MATTRAVMDNQIVRVRLESKIVRLTHYHDGQSRRPDRIHYRIGYSYGFLDHDSERIGSCPMSLLEMLSASPVLFCNLIIF